MSWRKVVTIVGLAIQAQKWHDSYPHITTRRGLMLQKTVPVDPQQQSWMTVAIGTRLELDGVVYIVDITDDQRTFLRAVAPQAKAA